MKEKTANALKKAFGKDPTTTVIHFDIPLKEYLLLKGTMKSKGYNSWKDFMIGELLE